MKIFYTILFLGLSLGASSQSINDSLLASYNFNSNTNDLSGNNFHLTQHNVSSSTGRNGAANGAYSFNGSNSYLSYTTDISAFKNNEYTFSVWVKFDAVPASGTSQIILSIGGHDRDQGLSIGNIPAFSGIGGYSYDDATPPKIPTLLDPNAMDTSWHNITTTRDLDSFTLYIDGKRIYAEYTGHGAAYTGSDLGFYIGCRGSNYLFLKAHVDEAKIWKRALSSAEIASEYSIANSINPIASTNNLIKVYPNPSSGKFVIENRSIEEPFEIRIYNALGQIVLSQTARQSLSEIELLEKGTYFVVASDMHGQLIGRQILSVK